MNRWSVETSRDFLKSLRKLDRSVAQRVLSYLDELTELDDPRSRGKPLSGDLSTLWRYRIGDYRLLVRIQFDRLVVVAVRIDHRSTVY